MSSISSTNNQETTSKANKPRLMSLDALRGFDMFWIIGGEGLFAAMFALTGWAGWQIAAGQMLHSQWHGFTLYDLIFPLFIFLSGVALGLSPKRLDKLPLQQRAPLYRHAIKRLALLIGLGVLYNHGWGTGVPLDPEPLDPEGVLSTIPAVVNALIGVFVGQFIVKPHPKGDWAKVLIMTASGLVLLLLGWLLNPIIPVNKDLWSSSFVLVTSGWSLLFLALFYAVIDVLKWQKWAFVFVVIGTNAIIVYLGSSLIDWHYITRSVFGGVSQAFPDLAQQLVSVIGFITVQWLILLWMYRRKIFIRI